MKFLYQKLNRNRVNFFFNVVCLKFFVVFCLNYQNSTKHSKESLVWRIVDLEHVRRSMYIYIPSFNQIGYTISQLKAWLYGLLLDYFLLLLLLL